MIILESIFQNHLIAIAKKRYGERKFKVVDAEKLKLKKSLT